MDYLSGAVTKLKKEATGALREAAAEEPPEVPQEAPQIPHADLLKLTMKLSKRLKGVEMALEKSEESLEKSKETENKLHQDLAEKESQLTRLSREATERDNASAMKSKELARLSGENAYLRKEVFKMQLDAVVNVARDAHASARLAATFSLPPQIAQFEHSEYKHRVEQDLARKSSLARQIVVEKDAEISRLSQSLAEMEKDAAAGGHAHRRILEIAEAQSQRDGAHFHEVRAQKIINAKLHRLLKKREGEINDLQKRVVKNTTNSSARKIDFEYLKNVVIQYLSLPVGSSERSSLVPVLATVLGFTEAEVKKVGGKHTVVDLSKRRQHYHQSSVAATRSTKNSIPDEFHA